MGIHVMLGDCRELLPLMPEASVDCVIVDPPYGETRLQWDKRVAGWPALVRRVLKPSGSMWVFGSMRMFLECAGEFVGWKLAQDIVWEKHNGTGLLNDRFRRVHEHALQFYRSDAKWRDVYKLPQFTQDARARSIRKKPMPAHWRREEKGGNLYVSEDGGPRLTRSVIFARSEHGRAVHPTQKPTEIVEPLLLYSCPPYGTVLDPFAGSGTVGVVAKRHRRAAILIEAQAKYIEAARSRLAEDAPLLQEAI